MSDRGKATEEELFKIVGYVVRQRPARLEPPPDEKALLQAALKEFATHTRVHVPTLASLVGLWMWYAILRRDLFRLPYSVFKFLDERFDTLVTWWPTTRREVIHMAAVLPLAFADIGAPPSDLLGATDARGAEEARWPGGGL